MTMTQAIMLQPEQLRQLPKEPLKGKLLLQYLKRLKGMSLRDKALHCGYYRIMKNQSIRINLEEFNRALLIACDLESPDKRRRRLSHETTVHQNGSVVIGSSYIRKVGYKPGQRLYIKTSDNMLCLVASDILEK